MNPPVVCFAVLWDKPKNLTPKSQAKKKKKNPMYTFFKIIFSYKKTTIGINYLKPHSHVYLFVIIFNYKKHYRNKYTYIHII